MDGVKLPQGYIATMSRQFTYESGFLNSVVRGGRNQKLCWGRFFLNRSDFYQSKLF